MSQAIDEMDAVTYTVSLKGDGSAPWVVVRSETAQQLVLDLSSLDKDLLDLINTAQAHLSEAYRRFQQPPSSESRPARDNLPPNNQQQAQSSQSTGHVGAQHPEGKTCDKCYAPVIGKEIKAKKDGKVYKLWSCPNNEAKNDGHYVEFIR